MKESITTLLHDIRSRGWRGLAIALLVATSMLTIMPGMERVSNSVRGVAWFVVFIAVAGLIAKDSTRNMKSTKSAVYSSIVIGTIWLSSAVEAVWRFAHDKPILKIQNERLADGSIKAASLEFAPIVVATYLAVVYLITGLIAYYIGKRRKDIKGIKNRDLFR